MEVREVRPDEFDEAGQVTVRAYREFVPLGDDGWEEYLARIGDVAQRADRTIVLVAVEKGRILGTATLEMDERTVGDDDDVLPPGMATLRMLGVDPVERGKGVGRALVEACMDRARAEGKSVFTLRTTPHMTAAHALYERMGFHRDAERDLQVTDDLTLRAYRVPL